MKLTPEQKAFFEYGAARTILSFQITQIKIIAKDLFGEEYKRLPTQERKVCCIEVVLDLLIKNVREKRAACREINRGHICKECINLPTDKCKECKWEFHSTRLKMTKSLWEPRKEGK